VEEDDDGSGGDDGDDDEGKNEEKRGDWAGEEKNDQGKRVKRVKRGAEEEEWSGMSDEGEGGVRRRRCRVRGWELWS
jgi:hypothetical protein